MVMPGIDPHGFGLPCALKAQAAVEIHGLAICNQHQLMEAFVSSKKSLHHLATDALTLMRRMNKHMGKVHDKMAVRDCVADAYKMT